ncbi:MAG: ankyrin repeat domain-containing protein [Gammaproteobacteria bacterium]
MFLTRKQSIFILTVIITANLSITHAAENNVLANTPDNDSEQDLVTSIYESLYSAIKMDSAKEIKQFISFGADINYRYEGGKTPLMLASSMGSIGAVKALLELGANPDLISEKDMTAMDYAHQNRDKFIVAVLKAKKYSSEETVEPITKKTSEDIIEAETIPKTIEIEPKAKIITSTQIAEKKLETTNTKPVVKPQKPKVVALLDTNKESTIDTEIKKIGEYPNISGTYNTKTTAIFSKCGVHNRTIEYFAKESIKRISKSGKFKITYSSPLLKCKGNGKFMGNKNNLKGNYNCSYKTVNGLRGTIHMKINGSIQGNQILMKYKGHDTTPGVSCNYDWERTISLN